MDSAEALAQGKRTDKLGPAAVAVAAFFVLAPPAAIAGGLALAPLQGFIGAGVAPWRSLRRLIVGAWPALTPLALFLLWFGLSACWSPYSPTWQPLRTASGIGFGLLFAAAAATAGPRSKRLIRAAGVAALCVLIALCLVEALADMPINRLGQPHADTGALMRNPGKAAGVLEALIWGAMGALVGRGSVQQALWKAMLLGAGFVALQFNMAANGLMFVVGALTFMFAYFAPRLGVLAVSWAWAGWLLAAPWATRYIVAEPHLLQILKPSGRVRIEIWDFAARHIAEKPWFGWGADAARTFNDVMYMDDIAFHAIQLHPHSFSMQIWLETGLVGALLLASCFIIGGFMLSKGLARQPAAAAAAAAAIAAIGASWNVSYGAWQEWWMTMPFAAAALAAAIAMQPARERPDVTT